DGFGYRMQQGRHVKAPQLGNVVIGDDVEIGACTTIDRGTIDATVVVPGTKIDNLLQIAHNCTIGPHNLIVSQVGIAGSSTTWPYMALAAPARRRTSGWDARRSREPGGVSSSGGSPPAFTLGRRGRPSAIRTTCPSR